MSEFWSLVKRLNVMCDLQPWDTTWYLRNLRSGEAAARGGDIVVASASTRKVSIMMAALAACHAGRLSLAMPVRIEARYQGNTSGCFQHLRPGFTITLQDAIVMMIIVSDNTCTGTVADMVGIDEINRYCQAAGMHKTLHRYGLPPVEVTAGQPMDRATLTTAGDQGLLLEKMLAGCEDEAAAEALGVTPELCRLAMEILSWQKLNTRLPAQLPLGTRVAHKTGTGPANYNDVGVVYGADGRPLFVLCCFTQRVPVVLGDGTPGFAAAAGLIARLARTAYEGLAAGE
jgi:beta-lactamase class A